MIIAAGNDHLFDLMTQTKGQLSKRLSGLRTLIEAAGGRNLRLTFVITSLNYKTMKDYAKFIHKNFPEIFYIEFNLVKVLGYAAKRRYLVPKLSELDHYLPETLKYCEAAGMKIITERIARRIMVLSRTEQRQLAALLIKLTTHEHSHE